MHKMSNVIHVNRVTGAVTLGRLAANGLLALDGDKVVSSVGTPTDGNVIVGDGSGWVAESGNTARTSLGLGTGDSPTFTGLSLTDTESIQITSPDNAKNCFDLDLFTSQTSDIVSCQNAYFTITNRGSGDVTNSLRALQAVCVQDGTGTVADMYCLLTQIRHYEDAAVVTKASGIGIFSPSITATGTIGTLYGLNIAAQSHAKVTTAYGVYQAGASDRNFFGGKCKFGTDGAPAEQIHVTDTIRADTFFNHNGTDGISTTFVDADGNTITVSGGIITAKTAP